MIGTLEPGDWGLSVAADGALQVGECRARDLARTYGTPLHVIHEPRLEETGARFRRAFEKAYPGRTSIHFAFKCNSVPAVLRAVRRAGLKAEVMSEFELDLALRLGHGGSDIIVNGPAKTPAFLRRCVGLGADGRGPLVVVDSADELEALGRIAADERRPAAVLLRINPDYVPSGMNAGTATGSRTGCAFGFDLKTGEADRALDRIRSLKQIDFAGFHFHIGTGIRTPRSYSRVLERLAPLVRRARGLGLKVRAMDVGGGFASMTTREMTTAERLAYQGWGRLPAGITGGGEASFEEFAREISRAMMRLFPAGDLPELVAEPGRSIASPNQFLLLTVNAVKTRPRAGTWIVTDGGLGTVCLPLFYEMHEVFLADDVRRPRTMKATIIGPVCFATDFVYRNKLLPAVHPGEILAVMDSGAYFTAQEHSFGFYRPAVAAVNGRARLVRRRESFTDAIGRDDPDEIDVRPAPVRPGAGPIIQQGERP